MAEASEGWLEELRWLRALARQLVGDSESADDLAQQAALISLARSPDPEPSERGWRAGVLRRLALHGHRGETRRRRREGRAARPEAVTSSEEIVERLEIHQQVIEAILSLGDAERRLVVLRWFEDRSAAEIARESGEPEPTVRSRLRRALASLRAELDRRCGGDRRKWAVPLVAWLGLSSGGAADLAAIEGVGAEAVGRVTAPVPPSPSRPTPPPSPLPRSFRPPALALEEGLLVGGKKIAAVAAALVVAGGIWWLADGPRSSRPSDADRAIVTGSAGAPESAASAELAGAGPARGTAPSPTPAGDRILLTGLVLDRLDDSPVAGALVTVIDGEREMEAAITDPGGRFEVAASALRESASLRLIAEGPEHVAGALELPGDSAPWPDPLPPLHLARGTAVAGRVLAEDGTPVAGARVCAFAPVRVETAMGGGGDPLVRRGGELPRRRVTDAEGGFRIVLPPGEAVLHATAPGLFGTTVLVLPRDASGDLVLRLAAADPWVGTVVDESGAPVEGARVTDWGDTLASADGIPFGGSTRDTRASRTDARGRFEIAPRAPEPGRLSVEHADFLPAERESDALGSAERASRTLAPIVLRRARALCGRFADAEGKPPDAGTPLLLAIGSRSLEGRIGAEGEFILRGVSPLDGGGELRIPGALDLELGWPPGADEHDLGVLLLDRGRSIPVCVIGPSGETIAGAAVSAGPRAMRPGQLPEAFARTGEDGIAILSGLAEGPVTISVWATGFALRSEEVDSLAEGAAHEVRLEPPASFRGRLVDSSGAPLAGAVVTLALASDRPGGRELESRVPREGATGRLSAVSGAAGEFRFPEVPPGVELRLRAEGPGRYPAIIEVAALISGQERDAGEIPTGGAGRLEVQVRGAAGEPLAGAWVEVSETTEKGARARSLPRVSVPTDAGGKAAIAGLASGPHAVEVRHGESVPWREILELEGGDQRLDVALEPGVAWEVEVVDDRGAPVIGARVDAYSLGTDGRRASAATDLSGRARVVPLPSEPVGYRVTSSDHIEFRGEKGPIVALPARVVLAPGGKVRIAVDRPAGGPPIERLRFSLAAGDRRSSGSFDIADGVWTIGGLSPGLGTLEVKTEGYTTLREELRIIAGEETLVVYRPEPDARPIEVRVADRESRPVPGASVWVASGIPGAAHIPLSEKGGGIYRGSAPLSAETVDVIVHPAVHAPLRVEDVDPAASPIPVVVGPAAAIELIARDPEGAPLPGLRVEVEGPDGPGQHKNSLLSRLIAERTDEAGRMMLDGLPPGRHTITLDRDRVVLSRTTLELAEGEAVTHEVTVARLIEISGRVVAAGRVLIPKQVSVSSEGSPVSLSVDADGRFHGLAPECDAADFTVWLEKTLLDFPSIAVSSGREVVLAYEPVAGELRFSDAGGSPVGNFQMSLIDSRSGRWFGAIAVDGSGVARYADFQGGRFRVAAMDLAERYALGIDEIDLAGGARSVPVVESERVVVRGGSPDFHVEISRIGADGSWRKYRPVGAGAEIVHIGPRDPSPGVFVLERYGLAPQLVLTAGGAPEAPVQLESRPGGTLVLTPFPPRGGEARSVAIEPLGAAELPEPLRTRAWSGVGHFSQPLPVGRFRIVVRGANGALATREVEIRALEHAAIEW